jgi:hypothetical protein
MDLCGEYLEAVLSITCVYDIVVSCFKSSVNLLDFWQPFFKLEFVVVNLLEY